MLWIIANAYAHRPGLSYAHIDRQAITLTFSREELAAHAPMADLQAARLLLTDLTLRDLRLDLGGICSLGEPTVTDVEADGVQIRAAITCPGGELGSYNATFLTQLAPGHRHYVEAFGHPVAVLDAANPSTAFTGVASNTQVALRFGELGVEHIWTGYDHLLFLFALLITAPSARAMLLIITGFTVAHSITLSLAALQLVHLSPSFVEPAIAASIAFVGVENFWRPPPRRRFVLTFLLGLIHGFGFGGLLLELGLPTESLTIALLSFNGGVEVGQAAVVLVTLPILLLLRRLPWWERRAVPVLSAGVVAAGVFWFVERVWA